MANQGDFPTRQLCETLKVSTSGYYDWKDRPLCERAKANATLTVRIKEAHQASDETYGMPRIRAELAGAGVEAMWWSSNFGKFDKFVRCRLMLESNG